MLNLLLQLSPRRPAVRVETIERRDFDDQRLRELHALSNALMAERFEHFCVHARTDDVVHVFRRADTGAIVGFQFWKTAPLGLPRSRAIVGGKLRIPPDFRTRGLHLSSGLLSMTRAVARKLLRKATLGLIPAARRAGCSARSTAEAACCLRSRRAPGPLASRAPPEGAPEPGPGEARARSPDRTWRDEHGTRRAPARLPPRTRPQASCLRRKGS
ncbi:hypothetical protein WMF20_14915 [Sorangium sp. So ce834]|uniref:hypothetical protein n=1 Tax=Sorangium sp. So ce834 TaxID=3133321 RepID=UPI003F60DD48